MVVKILGAGLSGLSAAINLAKSGQEAVVYEQKSDVGEQTHVNYQGLLVHQDVKKYLNSLNLNPEKFDSIKISRAMLCSRKRSVNTVLEEPIVVLARGGKNSLEYGLYKEAKPLGVEFKFNQKLPEEKVDIVATGRKKCDMAAFGCVYKGLDFPKDKVLYMHDDRYSPRGWYLYILPISNNMHEIVNCASQPHVGRTKELLFKAIKERPELREIVGDNEPVEVFGGYGGFDIPKTSVRDGRFYVGEAAGFQDPARGFGMDLALESGYLAAKAITDKSDYDALWRKRFKERMKKRLYYRFALSLFGDFAFEHAFRNVEEGSSVDFNRMLPSGLASKIIIEAFYRLEILKKSLTGHW